jgi:hypothetical protein
VVKTPPPPPPLRPIGGGGGRALASPAAVFEGGWALFGL